MTNQLYPFLYFCLMISQPKKKSLRNSCFRQEWLNSCITAYELPSLADNSKYAVVLSFIFKVCTKGYVVNSCLAPPLSTEYSEAVTHSATCSTNFR